MNATPKRWLSSRGPMISRSPDQGLWIECEVTSPPSAKGKSVDVYFPPDLVTPTLLAFRDAAREMRQ